MPEEPREAGGWRRPLIKPFAAVLLAACARIPDAPPPPTWTLVQEHIYSETVDLAGLSSLPALPVSESGHLHVPVDGRTRIAVIDSTGQLIHTIGRRGEGPGEFMRIASLELSSTGDLWVFDNRVGRVTRFDASYQAIEFHPAEMVTAVGVDGKAGGVVTLTETFRSFIEPSASLPSSLPAVESERRWILEYRGASRAPDTLAIIDAANSRFHVAAGSGRTLTGLQPWSDAPRLGRRADAQGILIAVPGEAGMVHLSRLGVSNSGDRAEAVARLPTGRVSAAVVDEWLDAFTSELRVAQVERDELRQALIVPREFPGVGEELLGFGDQAWVQLGRSWDRSEWAMLSATGDVVGTVRLPYASRIVAAREDRVWVATAGPLGVPMITRYRVTSPG